MATNFIEVLVPTGKTARTFIEAKAGIGNLNGKVLGLIDNGKPNYDIFLARLVELLWQQFKFARVVHVKKNNMDTGGALNPQDLQKLMDSCDIVLNGICDWGSCTTWSIHDAIELEKKGKPTVTICSDAFIALARTLASAQGMPSLRLIVIPHPIAGIPAEQVRAKADKSVDEIIRCLIGA